LNALNEGHKTYAEAGNNQGKHWSAFKETCLQIYRYIRVNEGCSLKDVLNNVNHHYVSTSTARSCIPKWAEAGKIDRIKVVKEDGKWRFYTEEKQGEGEAILCTKEQPAS
jgi:predicted transcriptional regulator